MFSPKFTFTSKLIGNIGQIERFYGQLEGLRIPQKLELNLERSNLIKSTYISNSIEGNPLSLPEVTNILLNDRIPVNRDEKEIKNYFQLLKSLNILLSQKLDVQTICQLHKKLLAGVDEEIAGKIRNKPVVIGKYIRAEAGSKIQIRHNPPFHTKEKIETEIGRLLIWVEKNTKLSPVIRSGIFHHQFVFIHPFEDGNGRACRLLTSLIFLMNDYAINKYFVLDDYYDIDRHLYSDKLHSADTGDKTQWLEYFTDGVKFSLQSSLSKYKSAATHLRIKDRLSPKEQIVLNILEEKNEITSNTLSEILHVSRQQAHNLLTALINKGFLGKKGSTKASFYYLK